jgi:dCMP deaminase
MERHQWLMNIAEAVAQKSPDEETKVGSVLVNNKTGSIVSTGFNGFTRGAPDYILPKIRPLKYKYIIHSEINLIYNSFKSGISGGDYTVYCTLSPCVECTRALFQCGIDTVIVKELYKHFNEVLEMKDLKVEVSNLPGTNYKLLKYYSLNNQPKE